MVVRMRWRHQRGKARDQLQPSEVQFIGLSAWLGAAVDELAVRLVQPIQRKRWARTVVQQALQPGASMHTLVSTENPLCW